MSDTPHATVHRTRLSWVWLIPVVAAVIAAFLAWRTLSARGPEITLSFRSGDGLTSGQTKVRYKAVELGTVEAVQLSPDATHVVVHVRMQADADRFLTDHARFWVVRPRLSSGSLSGIETIVSGSYIEMDPGPPGGHEQYAFTGLETPPAVRSGEPGTTYTVLADRLGSLASGAPVFYRDITVGEVLDYNIGNGVGPVTLHVFVRAPYDKLVRDHSHFWNASGLSVQIGPQGVHVELASLQAVLNGGIAYDTPPNGDPAPSGTVFKLYRDYSEARSAGFSQKVQFVSYFESSVRGLTESSPVELFGLQVGEVTGVKFNLNPDTGAAQVRVEFDIQPERILQSSEKGGPVPSDPVAVAERFVEHGMRAQLQSGNLITGTQILALNIDQGASPAKIERVGDDLVFPSEGGGLDNIMAAASGIASKLDRLPLDQIGANLNTTLRSASSAMTDIGELARHANSGLSPAFARLPTITASLESTVTRADRMIGSFDRSYGKDSDLQRELVRAMVQVGDTARSIRQLADFLDRHPEALIRGRAAYSQ